MGAHVKMAEVFRFEVEYLFRRGATWIYGSLLLLVPFLLLHAINGSSEPLNIPEMTAVMSTMLGMGGMLVSAALFGGAATRDFETGMHPLVFSAAIGRGAYLGGRFLGALAVNAVFLAGIPLGLIAATRMPYLESRMFVPFQAGTYLQPFFLLLLPNLVLSGAVLFAAAVLTRRAMGAYLAAVLLFVGYGVSIELGGDLGNRTLAALSDPFGVRTLAVVTQYWTPVEGETRPIGFPELLLWNRAIWLAVAAGVLAWSAQRFRFAHPGGAGTRRRGAPERAEPAAERTRPVAVPAAPRAFGARTQLRQALAVAGDALREMVWSRAFLAVVAGALLVVFLYGWDVGAQVFGTSSWPVTHLVAVEVLTVPFAAIFPIVIGIFAGELIWREREAGLGDIADAAPVPDWVPFAGRLLALVGVIVLLQAVLMAGGVLLQTLQGYHRYEPGVYLRVLFGVALADYVLFAVLALLMHVLVNHKYLGHLAVVLFYVFTMLAGRFGIRHNLLLYGSDPGWIYSDMSGFGPFAVPFVWFKLYWAAWALLLAVVANLLWVRGREGGARRRIVLARARFAGPAPRAAAVAGVLILALGGFIFYNTNVLNDYLSPFESDARLAEYERRYGRFADAPQPLIEHARLRVEIHPERRAVDLAGVYRLVNRTGVAIDSVHVIVHPDVRARALRFDRPAALALDDERLQYRIYALERALEPGDSLRLDFDLAFAPRGFPNSGVPTAVVRNGAYFDRRWLPIIGYQPYMELGGEQARREQGLAPAPPMRSAHDAGALRHRFALRDAELVHVDAVVGTAAGQIAVTPGTLVREWRENGRRYFHYRTEAPLPFGVPILSAEYAVREDRWNDVALRIFHHPAHDVNLPRMLRSMKASLDYYTEHFGPYPFGELRIVEFPRYASFARAHPHTIAFSEGSAFLTRVKEGDVDRTFFVTAHEIAHQWWGGQVIGARVEGAGFVSETMAQYSAMMVMEKAIGPEQARSFYDYEMDHYLRGRTVFSNRETPLLEVAEQPYLHYHKGAVAMYTLRERMGEERVNAALRRFLEAHRGGGPPYPTSRDLYRELRAAAPDSLHPLLRDLFEEITLWQVRAEEARVEATGTGAFRVTLTVDAAKLRADSIGSETEVPMDESVEVGVFGAGGGEPLYLRRHRIRSGRQTIVVTVPREPALAGIDPYGKLIDREREDNLVIVEAGRR